WLSSGRRSSSWAMRSAAWSTSSAPPLKTAV
ncbi:MAG: hypothetical protein AVDCRST_MAG90-1614, partial [uncultured Microvirga sp.]